MSRPWRSWVEVQRDIRQELAFAAAGIGDLVNIDPTTDDDDPDAPRCSECWWIWPEGAVRCAGCGYGSEASE